jgi:WD40 repeat protein
MTATIRIFLLFLLIGLPAAARADQPPVQAPQLRVDSPMHTAAIWDIEATPDGRFLVTASDDKTARIWNAGTGELIRTIRVPISLGSEGRVYTAAITPDARLVAITGWDHNYWQNYWTPNAGHFVYVYDVVSGNLLKRLGPLPQIVNTMQFSKDGQRLAVGMAGKYNGIRVWNAPFDELWAWDMGYDQSVVSLDYSQAGTLATASDDGFVRLYDASGVLQQKTEVPGGKAPRAVKFSPDGAVLAVAQIRSTNIDFLGGKSLKAIGKVDTSDLNNNDIFAIGWSNDGKTLFASGRYTDKDWNYPLFAFSGTGRRVMLDVANGPRSGFGDIAVLPGDRIAYASQDSSFGIFDQSGRVVQPHLPIIADMRNKYGEYFWADPIATAVRFGLGNGAINPFVFDVKNLTFRPSPEIPQGFIRPVTEGMAIENWLGAFLPTLNAQQLQLDPAEMSRSLAIAPDKQNFVIGTDWTINRFEADGTRKWRKNTEGTVWGVNLSADAQVVIAALGDGTIRWYRYDNGAELMALFVDATQQKWIVWTPKGYYAASPGGEDLIGWHVNGPSFDALPDFFPASRFRDQYYRPDIVQLVLTTMDEDAAIVQANANAGKSEEPEEDIRDILPAVIEFAQDSLVIETESQDISIQYRVRSPSGRAVTRIEVQIDGRPIQPRGAVPVEEGDDAKTVQLNIPPRDSEVTLIAYIDDQPGVPVTMPVKWKGKQVSTAKPNLYALLIGVSGYANNDLKLRYAAKDAQDLAAVLAQQKGVFYENVEVQLLLDSDASEVAVVAALTKLQKKAKPEDNVIVFMAGHGVTNATQDFYFLPADVDMTEGMMEATAIDGDIIRKGLSRIPGKVVLFMDACHAGNGIQGGVSRVDMTGVANGLSDGASVVMFASSTGREVSYESSEWQNGAFTEALLAVIGDQEAYGKDGLLSISELDENLTVRVEELTEAKQTPVMTKPGAIKRFHLASL